MWNFSWNCRFSRVGGKILAQRREIFLHHPRSLCVWGSSQPGRQQHSKPECFPSRILIFSMPGPGSVSKNLSVLTQKIVSKLSELWSRLFNPGSGSRIQILIFYPSRIQGSKKHRIPDHQHCSYFMISKWLSPRVLEKSCQRNSSRAKNIFTAVACWIFFPG